MIERSYKELFVPGALWKDGPKRQISYIEWGDRDNFPLICIHGLTRNAHDFDFLARVIAKNFRVIAIDVMGRGGSDYAASGDLYDYKQYVSDLYYFLKELKIKKCHFLGTSMGGIIGMIYATLHRNTIKKMILNDVGPHIDKEALARIGNYVTNYFNFPTFSDALMYFKRIFAGFGIKDEEKWVYFTKHSVVENNDGTFRLNYDPLIGDLFKSQQLYEQDMNLWAVWGLIEKTLPILLLRGKLSDILSDVTAKQMKLTHPVLDYVELEEVGHAPSLMYDEQINLINDWLLR